MKTSGIAEFPYLFEEPGTLEKAANLAADWFRTHFESDTERKDDYARPSHIGTR